MDRNKKIIIAVIIGIIVSGIAGFLIYKMAEKNTGAANTGCNPSCSAEQQCKNGVCICDPSKCSTGQICSGDNKYCVNTCTTACTGDQTCMNTVCVCDQSKCPDGQTCGPTGHCEVIKCSPLCTGDKTCKYGQCVCDNSKCTPPNVCGDSGTCGPPPPPGQTCCDPRTDGGTCLVPWKTPPGNNPRISTWATTVLDKQAIWDGVNNELDGIKNGPPTKNPTVDPNVKTTKLTALCPYGMYYDVSKTNMDPTAVFGSEDSPCIDHKPDNTNCKNYKLGQCLDDVQAVTVPSPLPRVFMTWFEIPTYISEATAQDYINTLLEFCKASQSHAPTKFAGITGICFPLVTWPDNKNMMWLSNGANTLDSTNANRMLYGKWVIDNFITPCKESDSQASGDPNVAPGILIYTNFKDGPWGGSLSSGAISPGFYSTEQAWALINPLTKKAFGKPPYMDPGWTPTGSGESGNVMDFAGCTAFTDKNPGDQRCAEWVWGAVIHFLNNYIIAQFSADADDVAWLVKWVWLHMDKEGCACGDPSQYITWVEQYLGSVFDSSSGVAAPSLPSSYSNASAYGSHLFLATGLGSPGQKVGNSNSISVPENYWYAGNQLPCGGDPGAYLYARTACTSLNTHRRLQDQPAAYYELTAGKNASDCCPGWLGDCKWATTVGTLKESYNPRANDPNALYGTQWVWPSFSIENLSLCDKDDEHCYSLWTKLNKEGKANADGQIAYDENQLSENSTVCAQMIFGTPTGAHKQGPTQGTRACGVFDGFSFWSFDGMIDWLNHFSNTTGAKNMIIYEASFIPYHWLLTLGLVDKGMLWKNGEDKSKTRNLNYIPAPTAETVCTNSAMCKSMEGSYPENSICVFNDQEIRNNGSTGLCQNICELAPRGLEFDDKNQTVWVSATDTDDATNKCTSYYSTPGATITGTSDTGTVVTSTNPFSYTCIGDYPGGYATGKQAGSGWTCQYHTNKK